MKMEFQDVSLVNLSLLDYQKNRFIFFKILPKLLIKSRLRFNKPKPEPYLKRTLLHLRYNKNDKHIKRNSHEENGS